MESGSEKIPMISWKKFLWAPFAIPTRTNNCWTLFTGQPILTGPEVGVFTIVRCMLLCTNSLKIILNCYISSSVKQMLITYCPNIYTVSKEVGISPAEPRSPRRLLKAKNPGLCQQFNVMSPLMAFSLPKLVQLVEIKDTLLLQVRTYLNKSINWTRVRVLV